MKKTYNKPTLKGIRLLAAEALLSASTESIGVDYETKVDGGTTGGILSNEEGAHDIWGNSGNSIW